LQYQGHEVHFTSLLEYQAHKENARPLLSLTHYIDLKKEKDIVLMKGQFLKDNLTSGEAQQLILQLQLYYAVTNTQRAELVKHFHESPSTFEYQKLIEQAKMDVK
jgi:ATP synthase F1 complex assembly factor 1